jgi:hypothetical protein
MIILQK